MGCSADAVTPTNSAGSGELSSGDLEGCDGVLRVRLRLPSSRPRGYRKLGGAPGGAGKRRRCDVARRRTSGAPGRIAANSKRLAKSPRSTRREESRTREELLLAALHSGKRGSWFSASSTRRTISVDMCPRDQSPNKALHRDGGQSRASGAPHRMAPSDIADRGGTRGPANTIAEPRALRCVRGERDEH